MFEMSGFQIVLASSRNAFNTEYRVPRQRMALQGFRLVGVALSFGILDMKSLHHNYASPPLYCCCEFYADENFSTCKKNFIIETIIIMKNCNKGKIISTKEAEYSISEQ